MTNMEVSSNGVGKLTKNYAFKDEKHRTYERTRVYVNQCPCHGKGNRGKRELDTCHSYLLIILHVKHAWVYPRISRLAIS